MFTLNGRDTHSPSRVALIYNPDNNDHPSLFVSESEDSLYSLGTEYKPPEDFLLMPCPSTVPNQRDCIYIAGPSGCGKSTYITKYAGCHKRLYPKRNIYLISSKATDKEIDACSSFITRIPRSEWSTHMGPKGLKDKRKRTAPGTQFEYLPIEMYAKSLWIFDDCENDDMVSEIQAFRKRLIELGREQQVNVVVVSHMITNFNLTRNDIGELTHVVIFPHKGVQNNNERFLKVYLKLSNVDIKRIYDDKTITHAITIKVDGTRAAICENKAWLL